MRSVVCQKGNQREAEAFRDVTVLHAEPASNPHTHTHYRRSKQYGSVSWRRRRYYYTTHIRGGKKILLLSLPGVWCVVCNRTESYGAYLVAEEEDTAAASRVWCVVCDRSNTSGKHIRENKKEILVLPLQVHPCLGIVTEASEGRKKILLPPPAGV